MQNVRDSFKNSRFAQKSAFMFVIIILITVIISVVCFKDRSLFYKLSFNPYSVTKHNESYRVITHGFVHADWMHLLLNMFVLYTFSDNVERAYVFLFGMKGYLFLLFLYVGALLFSVIPSWAKHKDNVSYNSVGASGAVSAVVFASIILFPSTKMMLLILPIPMPAWIFGILYLIFEAYNAKRGQTNIGHDAHFAGAIYGAIFTLILDPKLGLSFLEQLTR